VKCVTFVSENFTRYRYGSSKTNVWQKILTPNNLAFLYENPSTFVKVRAKKSVAPFYGDTVYTVVFKISDRNMFTKESTTGA